jgi:ketosteroid isomerase-like protein
MEDARSPSPNTPPPLDALTVAKRVFAGYALGDDDGILALAHPDSRWFFPGNPAIIPWAGWWEGRTFWRFLDAVKDAVDFLEYSPLEFVPIDAERVIVRCFERCVVKATGKEHHNHHMGILTVRDGQVVAYFEYSDTAAQQEAFQD